MLKNGINHENYYKSNSNNKNVSKRSFNSVKNIAPLLAHQENNYYYNTKINHLILQGPSNSKKGKNSVPTQNPLYNSVYINYDLLAKNTNNNMNTNFINQKREETDSYSLNKDNKNIISLDNFSTNRRKINRNSKNEDISYNKYINSSNNYINDYCNNKNNYNPFQVMNYLKKKNTTNNNIFNIVNKELHLDYSNDIYENALNISKSGILQKKTNPTNIDPLSYRSNNQNYDNNENNNNNLDKRNIKSNLNGRRKIPLKKDKIGNYEIKSPGHINSQKYLLKFNEITRINVGKKNSFKSPENSQKNKTKNIPLKNGKNKNLSLNKNSLIYNTEAILYKRNEKNIKSSYNISNNILQKNNMLNKNIKTSSINNNNNNNNKRFNKKCNIIYNSSKYFSPNSIINDKFMPEDEKKLNTHSDIYFKINPKNFRLIDSILKKNNIVYESPRTNFLSDKKMKTNFNHSVKNMPVNFAIIKTDLERFCDILEQFYYNSFKNCFNFFIEKIASFTQQKNLNRAVVLRRLTGGKKHKISHNLSNINNNISRDSKKNNNDDKSNNNISRNSKKNNNDDISNNKEINNPRKKKNKSPSKFVELQQNLMPSMMKINQDNYIEMFNDLFKRTNQSFDDKKSRSPIIGGSVYENNINIFRDSFDLENNIKSNETFNKYNTNTNVNNYYPKRNNLKTNIDSFNKNSKRINNIFFQRTAFRPSLSSDNKRHANRYSDLESRKYIKNINHNFDNNIYIENNMEDSKQEFYENTVFYDSKIFQKQKYKISNSPDPYLYNYKNSNSIDNSERREIVKSQTNKNILLYTKPLLKKSVTKDSDFLDKSNKSNIINSKKKERNYQETRNKINSFHSHNIIRVNQNLSKALSNININQRSIFENKNNSKEEIKTIFNRKNKYSQITIKDVSTKDNRLHVFIKYVEIGKFPNNYTKKEFNEKLFCNLTDSFSLINKNQEYSNRNISFNKENEFDNVNIEKNRFYNYISEKDINNFKNTASEYFERENSDEKNNNNKLENIGEEESQSNQLITINNSIFSVEQNETINEDMRNSTIYLINFLQNMYNDNKKLILFNFFKNLKKIKTNSLLHTSMKTKIKNKTKNTCIINSQRYNNKNIIEINNFNNYKNISNNKSDEIKLKSDKTKNLKYDLSKSLNINMTRKRKNDYSLNITNKIQQNEVYKSDKKVKNENTLQDINYYNKHRYNNSFNNNKYNTISHTNYSDKKDSLIEDNNKSNEVIAIKYSEKEEKNCNIKEKGIEDEKKKMKEMKLAKLGKIFKNLEKENNIINAIRGQFFEWTNSYNLENIISEDRKKEDEESKNKDNEIQTFDDKYDFNKNNESEIKKKNENKNGNFRSINFEDKKVVELDDDRQIINNENDLKDKNDIDFLDEKNKKKYK